MVQFVSHGNTITKIVDLRESDISYYLPIDGSRIFFRPSLQNIHHIEEPCLYYNAKTKLTHTQFYIRACLLENLELFMFPFDRQFLNIKLRWNIDYYRILHFEDEKNIPIENELWWAGDTEHAKRNRNLYHDNPLKISLKESMEKEVKLYPTWIDFTFSDREDVKKSNLRFALIRGTHSLFLFKNTSFKLLCLQINKFE